MTVIAEGYVGIDVAKRSNAVAIADAGREGEIRHVGEVDASPHSMTRLAATVDALPAMQVAAMISACRSALSDGISYPLLSKYLWSEHSVYPLCRHH